MNIKNALGFFVLGMFMHTTPVLAQTLSESLVLNEFATRYLWLEFMSWVVGGIGLGYLSHVGALRVYAFATAIIPEGFGRTSTQTEPVSMQTAVRVGMSY